ncbi:hypothetical protein BD289DRAFT_481206 [Coniella lustricola]|uniref:Uncharacterized protein n=1 Tax=Coniella lustricola TaxID=2025994 RepID=A0A2T3AD92_9PEZI|nr:hypothetical protein BD289DRAFT_481206 [Coniella lustricola]
MLLVGLGEAPAVAVEVPEPVICVVCDCEDADAELEAVPTGDPVADGVVLDDGCELASVTVEEPAVVVPEVKALDPDELCTKELDLTVLEEPDTRELEADPLDVDKLLEAEELEAKELPVDDINTLDADKLLEAEEIEAEELEAEELEAEELEAEELEVKELEAEVPPVDELNTELLRAEVDEDEDELVVVAPMLSDDTADELPEVVVEADELIGTGEPVEAPVCWELVTIVELVP